MNRYQEGCLQKTKRKNGSHVWTFRWYDMTGEKRTYRKRVIGTLVEMPLRRDAEMAVAQLRQKINSSVVVPETVSDVITHYRELELVPARKAYATIEASKLYLANQIEPRWGTLRLSAVRTVEVEAWLDQLPYAPGTRSKIRNLLSAVFSHAIRHELIDRNPIRGVRTSAKRQREPDVLTPAEFARLLDELETRDRAMVILAGSTGLRRSELVALTWADVNLESRLVHVRRSCVRNHFGETKTEASRKPVPLHGSVVMALAVWRRQSPYSEDGDFLFPSLRLNGKQPISPDTLLKKVIRPALVSAGVVNKRIGWHSFRHSLATNLRAIGVEVKTAQELLRHANSRITLDFYTQAISANKRAANDNVMELMLANGQ
jgi:integrase